MALILNLETATTNCSVSLAREGRIIALEEDNSPGYSHAEKLHEFIEKVLQQAALELDALDAVAVSKGPGSYTGLRIGVSAAKGLCYSLGVPLLSVATLDSLGAQVSTENGVIIPLLDARRMEVYSKVLDSAWNEIRETRAEVVDENSFSAYAEEMEVHLVGSGAEKCRDILPEGTFHYHPEAYPSAREMSGLSWRKYQAGQFEDVAYFEPYYLKDFVAHKKKA